MEIGILIVTAFAFFIIGCALGWRAGEQNGARTTTEVMSGHIRRLEKQAAEKVSALERDNRNLKQQLAPVDAKLNELKAKLEDGERQIHDLGRQVKDERHRFETLAASAEAVAQSQSRISIVNLQAILENLKTNQS